MTIPGRRSRYIIATPGKRAVRAVMMAVAYRVWKRNLRRAGFKRPDDRVLVEIGAGPGFFIGRLRRWFPHSLVVGTDVDAESVRFAAAATPGSRCLCADAHDLPFRNGAADAVAILQVIEHLSSPDRFLAEARRILKDKGLLLFATPNPSGIGARVRGRKWQGYCDDHISLRTPEEWLKAAEAAGFRVLDHGTTGLTAIPLLKVPPFSFVNWVPMSIFGYFHWRRGDSAMFLAQKEPGP